MIIESEGPYDLVAWTTVLTNGDPNDTQMQVAVAEVCNN